MGVLRELFGPSKDEMWALLAEQVSGQFNDGGWLGKDYVQARVGDWLLTLDTYTVSTGKSSTTYTRFRAPFVNRDQFHFAIHRAGLFTPVARFFGMQDLEIGEPFFDHEFVVQSNNPQKVGAMLSNSRIRDLLRAQPQVGFRIQDDEGWFGPHYPEGVDQLYFQVHGTMTNLAHLRGVFDLFSEVLNHLCHLDSAYKDDVDLLIAALRQPGGRVESGGVLLWDGDLARDRAIQGLEQFRGDRRAVAALLEALPAASPQLRNGMIHAIGALGDPQAVPHLIPYLGGADGAPGRTGFTGATAAVAVRALGFGPTVDTFAAVLAGQLDHLDQLDSAWTPLLVTAFRSALGSNYPVEVASAGRALAQWGVVEALPDIRAAARRFREDPSTREALDGAIQELQKRSSLPRPAEGPAPAADGLPLPAGAPRIAEEDLPRPA